MLRKFTRAEATQVVTPEGHKAIEDELHKLGKTSARELSEGQRSDLRSVIDNTDTPQ